MTDDKALAFQRDFAKLAEDFLLRLERSVEAIDNILSQHQMGTLKKDDFSRAQHLVHGLAGSGSIFGFPEITEAGRTADKFILDLLKQNDGQNIPESDFAEFERLMQAMRAVCDAGAHSKKRKPAPELFGGIKAHDLPKTYHVVVVDDDVEVSNFLSKQLTHSGILVTVAADGISALREIRKNPPDLVILDVSMPGMTGHDVLREMKQTADLVAIPVLMLTGMASREDTVTALHAGAIDYVVKPYDPVKLIERILSVLDSARYTVMIIDNDELVLQLLDSKFRNAGFRTILLADGREAWDRILKEQPDLIILDRMIPGIEGLGVLKNIRAEKLTSNIPVIILSARQEPRDIELGMQMGAQEYMGKPFVTDEALERGVALLKKDKSKFKNSL